MFYLIDGLVYSQVSKWHVNLAFITDLPNVMSEAHWKTDQSVASLQAQRGQLSLSPTI